MSRNVYRLQHKVWVPPIEQKILTVSVPDGIDPAWFCRRMNRFMFGYQMPRRLRSRYAPRPK